jgi:hypothetical protein
MQPTCLPPRLLPLLDYSPGPRTPQVQARAVLIKESMTMKIVDSIIFRPLIYIVDSVVFWPLFLILMLLFGVPLLIVWFFIVFIPAFLDTLPKHKETKALLK